MNIAEAVLILGLFFLSVYCELKDLRNMSVVFFFIGVGVMLK